MSSQQVCGSYGPGHLIHWILAKKSREPDQPVIPVRIVAVHDDGRVELEGRDLAVTLWHHDVGALRRACRQAVWRPRFRMLAPASGGRLFLAAPAKAAPCVPPIRRRPDETVRQYIERAMRENHGYTVPRHWLADLDAIPNGDSDEPQSGCVAGTKNPTPEEKALLRKSSEEFGGYRPYNDVEGRWSQMPTSRSSQEWRDSWAELRPHLSWMQRQSVKIIDAERPDQIEEFIWKHRGHRFTDEEIQGLRDGSIREAVKEWRETTIRMAKERTQRERQERRKER